MTHRIARTQESSRPRFIALKDCHGRAAIREAQRCACNFLQNKTLIYERCNSYFAPLYYQIVYKWILNRGLSCSFAYSDTVPVAQEHPRRERQDLRHPVRRHAQQQRFLNELTICRSDSQSFLSCRASGQFLRRLTIAHGLITAVTSKVKSILVWAGSSSRSSASTRLSGHFRAGKKVLLDSSFSWIACSGRHHIFIIISWKPHFEEFRD
jgi:hypothetical protein